MYYDMIEQLGGFFLSLRNCIIFMGGEAMQKSKSKKVKLPKRKHTLRQFGNLIIFLFSMIATITTIVNNIHNMFK